MTYGSVPFSKEHGRSQYAFTLLWKRIKSQTTERQNVMNISLPDEVVFYSDAQVKMITPMLSILIID
jgi:hypothetical protein